MDNQKCVIVYFEFYNFIYNFNYIFFSFCTSRKLKIIKQKGFRGARPVLLLSPFSVIIIISKIIIKSII